MYTNCKSLEIQVFQCHQSVAESSGLQQSSVHEMQLHVFRTVSCSPRSGCFVTCSVPKCFSEVATVAGGECPVVVPCSLHRVENHKIDVWVLNDSTRPLRLENGTLIGVLENVDEIITLEDDAPPPCVVVSAPSGEEESSLPGKRKCLGVDGSAGGSDLQFSIPEKKKEVVKVSCDYLPEGFEDIEDGFIDDGFNSFDAVGDFGAANDGYLILPHVDLHPSVPVLAPSPAFGYDEGQFCAVHSNGEPEHIIDAAPVESNSGKEK